jgi:hypothetical protein
VLAYVRALGRRLPDSVTMSDLLPRICAEVPGTTVEEVRAAVRWSLQRSKRREAAIERAMRMGCRREPSR